MKSRSKVYLGVFASAGLLAAFLYLLGRQFIWPPSGPDSPTPNDDSPAVFAKAITMAEGMTLLEGLPHQGWEPKQLEHELKTKAVRKLYRYPFYQEPLDIKNGDGASLTRILSDPKTYEPFSGEKKCGGFHPDYAVEWHHGTDHYQVVICFGCGEIKMFKHGRYWHCDIAPNAESQLSKILLTYRKNRPLQKLE